MSSLVDNPGNVLTYKLLELMEKTGYSIIQRNGQRRFGPPPDWEGPPPARGCEIFIGKLPREIFEDVLVPIFSQIGKIYELRLMMDFSGSNRGYAFVTYTTRADAYRAIKELNGHEIRPGRHIGVVKSVDNCRLFIGGIPRTKTKEEIQDEISNRVKGVVDVIVYKNCFDRKLNRGFAFVEFTSHRTAAMARRALVPGCVKLWDQPVMVDWAEPEPDVDDSQMNLVRVLYVRNFSLDTTPEAIQMLFESAIASKVAKVKKIYDYAFIHFYSREHAELAKTKLDKAEVGGSHIEIYWAKPVNRELYKLQKMNRGNAKFNTSSDLTHTLLLYNQHLEQKEYANSPREDEGFGSACAGESSCGSPLSGSPNTRGSSFPQHPYAPPKNYLLAPAKLDAMCRRYMWAPPKYDYQRFVGTGGGGNAWLCRVELPGVGAPLLSEPRSLRPMASRLCSSLQQAQVEAAESALHYIEVIRGGDTNQQPTTSQPPVYTSIMPPVGPYEYYNSQMPAQMFSHPLPPYAYL